MEEGEVVPGAWQISRYYPLIEGKNVAVTVNHSSRIDTVHLVDSLLKLGINVIRIFTPEHGFRGTVERGISTDDETDSESGIPVVSLYGSKRKPFSDDLRDVEIMLFDIQDVGVRFYTYISTMHNVMEACAARDIPVIVLDRPNPNGHYVDGPVLDPAFRSFVGMHPIPVVYGMTIGELALMINGEGWLGLLANDLKCSLTVIPCAGYGHSMNPAPDVPPSPSLPNLRAILLYPSLCFFEPTTVSVGRGTPYPFQVIGHPAFAHGSFTFTPRSMPGASSPKHESVTLQGTDLRGLSVDEIRNWRKLELGWLISHYQFLSPLGQFFQDTAFFDKLAGTDKLRKQLQMRWTEEEIRDSWQEDLNRFKDMRRKYLLYPDFGE